MLTPRPPLYAIFDFIAHWLHVLLYQWRWVIYTNDSLYSSVVASITRCKTRQDIIDILNVVGEFRGVSFYRHENGRACYITIGRRVILIKMCDSTTHTFMLVGVRTDGIIAYTTLYGAPAYTCIHPDNAEIALSIMKEQFAPSWWHASIHAEQWRLGFW